MEKTITLNTEEICNIVLALQDKVINTRASFKVTGITMSEQTKRRLDAMEELAKKIFVL